MCHDHTLSPLEQRHRALGAKSADFGGWLMPIEYAGGGVIAEHTAVRERVGIFDVSHLGNVAVTGQGAARFINECFTNDLARIGPGHAQYTMCCDEDGGVVDDLIVYLRSEDDVMLVPNAANTAEVVRLLTAAAPAGITVTDEHTRFGIIAVQGPSSPQVLEALDLPVDMDYMAFGNAVFSGIELTVCRTGYTGEKGFELVVPWDDTVTVWDALTAAMAPLEGRPCGLGARDTLRTEMGYALHGHELSRDITPSMARAVWAVGWDKPAFWGKAALERQRAARTCRLSWGLLATGRGIPRPGCLVRDAGGAQIGVVSSGTMSPTLRQGIALAFLDRGVSAGDEVTIEVRGRAIPARVQRPPFVPSHVTG